MNWVRAIAGMIVLAGPVTATWGASQPKPGDVVPDFPPGVFTDGQQYRMADLKGKVVAIYLYEKDCPGCMAKTKNEVGPLVQKFKDKPVKFIAVAPGDTAMEVKQYIGATQMKMPVYIDTYQLMEKRYGESISLQNIYQWKIVDADGKLASYTVTGEWMDRAMATAKWTYKDDGYHTALASAVDHFEWGRYEAGMKVLKPLRKHSKSEIAESANKLYDAVKVQGQAWRTEATAEGVSPVVAFDQYTRLKSVFDGDAELMEGVDAALTTFKKDKAVTDELAARKMFSALASVTGRPKPPTPTEVATGYRTIAKKYPESPTGVLASELATEIGQ